MAESLGHWEEWKAEVGGHYHYAQLARTFSEGDTRRDVEVRGDQVVFRGQSSRAPGAPWLQYGAPGAEVWFSGEDGTALAVTETIESLYEACDAQVLTKDRARYEVTLTVDDRGLLQECSAHEKQGSNDSSTGIQIVGLAAGPAVPPASEVEARLSSYLAAQEALSVRIHVGTAAQGFLIQCPIGERCDEHYAYRAVRLAPENPIDLYLSFDASVALDPTLEDLRAGFRYAYGTSHLVPELEPIPGWAISIEFHDVRADSPAGSRVEFLEYAGASGLLRGRITTPVGRLTAVRLGPDCPYIADAPPVEGCRADLPIDPPVPFELSFSAPLQTGT